MFSYYTSVWVCVCQNITVMSAWTSTPVHVRVIFLSFMSLKQLSMDTKNIKRSRCKKSEKQNTLARTNMKKALHLNRYRCMCNYYHLTQRGFRGTGLVFSLLKPNNCSNTFSELLSYHRSAHRFPLNRCVEDNIAKRVLWRWGDPSGHQSPVNTDTSEMTNQQRTCLVWALNCSVAPPANCIFSLAESRWLIFV